MASDDNTNRTTTITHYALRIANYELSLPVPRLSKLLPELSRFLSTIFAPLKRLENRLNAATMKKPPYFSQKPAYKSINDVFI